MSTDRPAGESAHSSIVPEARMGTLARAGGGIAKLLKGPPQAASARVRLRGELVGLSCCCGRMKPANPGRRRSPIGLNRAIRSLPIAINLRRDACAMP